jgi:ribosomal-protein-alanine N-acetyltransferase
MLEINFTPFPNLETERLILRRSNKNDVSEMFALRSNPETMQYIPRPLVTTNEEALANIALMDNKIENNEGINWAITCKGSPKLIGVIGHYRIKKEHYRSEIGYILLPEYAGYGIVSEALNAVVEFGFEKMNLHSIEAIINPNNISSERVLQKNGFVKEAHLLENEFFEGHFIDQIIYSLLKRNFKK